ncbi:hypothetical protein RvY_03335 [Ramazzottius varieornatus]|uniref:Uncharacterized protein n=1 Tax=Ramazzottius varieornatus TaxID=947166 RepID=A0A1D1UUR1_RAMVA|nr:hypothetical protein RvY_03335 [Ramazzottius varieornatus]
MRLLWSRNWRTTANSMSPGDLKPGSIPLPARLGPSAGFGVQSLAASLTPPPIELCRGARSIGVESDAGHRIFQEVRVMHP